MRQETDKNIQSLSPMVHVTDVQRSVDFYSRLGFEPLAIGKHEGQPAYWAHVRCGKADLMFAHDRESGKVEKENTVVLYMYAEDLVKLRDALLTQSVKVSDISYPAYMPRGEVCLSDPDGYVVLIGQSD